MMASVIENVVLGRGVLNWNGRERRTDRYGSVQLYQDVNSDQPIAITIESCEGKTGSLIASVVKTRQSPHIGDLFRGFSPSTPEEGEQVVLGTGELFSEDDGSIGLCPNDGRESDWLNPESLYRVHFQTVDLIFRQGNEEDLNWG